MRSRAELAASLLQSAGRVVADNVSRLTLDEALSAAGGFRSVLGILKHTAAWSHVYYSYAMEPEPRHWRVIDWPAGLRDTIEPSRAYLEAVRAWFDSSRQRWVESVEASADETLDEPRPCHWGATAPLFDIVVMVANHWTYHAGELNQVLATVRGEAWEYTEEVEENHISTAGHRMRPMWMSDEQAARYEAYLAERDRQSWA